MNSTNTTAAASAEKQRIKKLERDRARMREKRASDEKKIQELEIESLSQEICIHTLSGIIEVQAEMVRRRKSDTEIAKWNARFAYFMVAVLAAALVATRF